MKAKNIATVVVIAVVAGILASFFSASFITSKKSLTAKVEVVEPISKDFNFQGKTYFTPNAINPTRTITIDGNNNTSPLEQK